SAPLDPVVSSPAQNDLFFQARPFDLRSGYALLGTRLLDVEASRFVARDPQEVMDAFEQEHSYGEHESIDQTLDWINDGQQAFESMRMLDAAFAVLDPIGTAVESGLTAIGVDEGIAAGAGIGVGVLATVGTKLITEGIQRGTKRLAGRAGLIHGTLDARAQSHRTTAVLRTDAGDVVASGGRDLSPAQRAALEPGESAASLPGAHAEVTALNHAQQAGLSPEALVATRPFCPDCSSAIQEAGGTDH
ncbi:MAG: hypothetical protein AAF682_29115, partial [Planctomycetota bacterium]